MHDSARKYRFVGFLLVALTAMLAVISMPHVSQARTLAEIASDGTVRIGVVTGSPPMGMVDPQGNPTGYDVDVANLIGKYMSMPVEIVPLTPPARIPALLAGQIDFLVATMTPTGERAKSVMFTTPYNAFNLVIMSGPGKKYESLADLAGARVSVNNSGSPQELALRRAGIEGLEIVNYEDDATAIQAVISGQVDATSIPSTVAKAIIEQKPDAGLQIGVTLFRQGNSMATRLDDYEIRQYLNTLIYLMKVSGELDAISRKWTGDPLPPQLPSF